LQNLRIAMWRLKATGNAGAKKQAISFPGFSNLFISKHQLPYMRIGIVCYPTFGGSGVLATELGKALATKGHQVHFITYQQPVRLTMFVPNIYYHEVQVPTYPLFDYPPYETALASTLVDVISANSSGTAASTSVTSAATRRRTGARRASAPSSAQTAART